MGQVKDAVESVLRYGVPMPVFLSSDSFSTSSLSLVATVTAGETLEWGGLTEESRISPLPSLPWNDNLSEYVDEVAIYTSTSDSPFIDDLPDPPVVITQEDMFRSCMQS